MKAELFVANRWLATLSLDVAASLQIGDIVSINDKREMSPCEIPPVVCVVIVSREYLLHVPQIVIRAEYTQQRVNP